MRATHFSCGLTELAHETQNPACREYLHLYLLALGQSRRYTESHIALPRSIRLPSFRNCVHFDYIRKQTINTKSPTRTPTTRTTFYTNMFSQVMISSQVTPSRPAQVVRQVNDARTHGHYVLRRHTSALSDTNDDDVASRPTRASSPKRQRKLSFTRLLRFAKRGPPPDARV
ncbi:hypothetical protein FB451DRAFT_1278845 [Mycena latifolia]|nr:hypothetical protein FB451DRAFT_1278845 [Mycena latifolia]